ncbi:MAG: DUF2891 domain-containing protein [Nitriliruptorales bacterium]|nr:DUF2891 domain-containing protein [Nitriliruptorales bacterium]
MIQHLDAERAGRWARAAVSNATRTYPNAPQALLRGPGDLRPPDEVHPAFHGSFDWHSAVHTHWSLVRLLRLFPDLDGGDDAREVLSDHLTAEALGAELRHLEEFPSFERPYGWAWAVELAAEVARWDDADTVVDGSAVADFGDSFAQRLFDHLPRLTFPVRSGTHSNTAFAMLLALDHGREVGHEDLEARVVATARRWYLRDRDAPVDYEPSGEDFLSPVLTEAHLLAEVLSPDDFDVWFEGFLPGSAQVIASNLREPIEPVDVSGRLSHLRGLTLSRAWNWRAIAGALPARDERRVAALDAADRHLADGLDHVLTGDYAGDHWLVTFGLLAVTGL